MDAWIITYYDRSQTIIKASDIAAALYAWSLQGYGWGLDQIVSIERAA